MSQLLTYFRTQSDESKKAAREIMDRVDTEARDITVEEKAEVEAHMRSWEDFKTKASAEEAKITLRKQIEDATGNTNGLVIGDMSSGTLQGDPGLSRDIGEFFVKSGVFGALQARKKSLPKGWVSTAVEFPYWGNQRGQKALPVTESDMTDLFGNGSTAGSFTSVQGLESPGMGEMPFMVSNLIPSVPVDRGTITVPIAASRTLIGLSDIPIAEGGAKKALDYDFEPVVYTLQKIAGYTKLSTELLDDAPAVAQWIRNDIPRRVRRAEEEYVVDGLYDNVSDASSLSGGTTGADEILAAIIAIQMAGGTPDALVISPLDWGAVLVSKLGTGAGDKSYVGGGPFAATNNPWGVRVVVSPFATSSHPLIGDFRGGATIYRNGGLSVDTTNTDGDDFIKNLFTIRAEERLVVAKNYPEYFATADLS